MRKITSTISKAFDLGISVKMSNTRTDGNALPSSLPKTLISLLNNTMHTKYHLFIWDWVMPITVLLVLTLSLALVTSAIVDYRHTANSISPTTTTLRIVYS